LRSRARGATRGAQAAAAEAMSLAAWRADRAVGAARLRANPAGTALILAVDGVLAETRATAGRAALRGGMGELLDALARRFALLAVVSNRRAAEAKRLVGMNIPYAGLHGGEIILPGERPQVRSDLRPWRRRIQAFAKRAAEPLTSLGVQLELTGPIAVFRWQGAEDADAAIDALQGVEADARARGLATQWEPEWLLMEIRPPIDFEGGAEPLLALAAPEVPLDAVLYVGASRADATAMNALRAALGSRVFCVGVGPNAPPVLVASADLIVDGLPGVQAFLRLVLVAG
jgi:trehalose 6-phosphate phosphatase